MKIALTDVMTLQCHFDNVSRARSSLPHQERSSCQILGQNFSLLSPFVRSRNEQYKFVFKEWRQHEVAIARWAFDEPKHDLFFFDRSYDLFRIAARQSWVDSWVCHAKFTQEPRQYVLRYGR